MFVYIFVWEDESQNLYYLEKGEQININYWEL